MPQLAISPPSVYETLWKLVVPAIFDVWLLLMKSLIRCVEGTEEGTGEETLVVPVFCERLR